MLRYDTRQLVRLRNRLRLHLTFLPFFRALEIAPEQRRYFFRGGVDNARLLKDRTVRARRRRWGYYRQNKTRGVSAELPYGVWTGNTWRHTTEERGRKTVRVGFLTIRHNLKRRIVEYWDVRQLDRYVERAAEEYFQRVLDGRRLPRRLKVRAA